MSEERTSADAVVEEIPVQEEDFAALFEKESKMPERLEPGQKIRTTVIPVSGEMVYVDLGGKSRA